MWRLVGGNKLHLLLEIEKRHLRLRPDYSRDPRFPRRRHQVDVVLGPWPRTVSATPRLTHKPSLHCTCLIFALFRQDTL